jgi:hypothetical protein
MEFYTDLEKGSLTLLFEFRYKLVWSFIQGKDLEKGSLTLLFEIRYKISMEFYTGERQLDFTV